MHYFNIAQKTFINQWLFCKLLILNILINSLKFIQLLKNRYKSVSYSIVTQVITELSTDIVEKISAHITAQNVGNIH